METLEVLKTLGFTEYEAKAYLALLAHSPATGYAVSKNSGVPRSKVYEVLDSLTARGDVLVSPGNPPLYQALPAKELIAARKAATEKNFQTAERTLEQFERSGDDCGNIWNITGAGAVLQKAKECIDLAEKRILLEIWAEDFPAVAANLQAAAERGVTISIVSYGEICAAFAQVYPHDMSDQITAEYGGRWIVLSADDDQVVAGTVSMGDESRAAWTKHQGLVMPITEVVIHDLYIAEMLNAHRDILEETFGKNLLELRKKFLVHPDNKKHYIK